MQTDTRGKKLKDSLFVETGFKPVSTSIQHNHMCLLRRPNWASLQYFPIINLPLVV